jgi:uncharacterized protein
MIATQKTTQLAAILTSWKKVAIAMSGGVDSTFLAAFASETLGPGNVLLINAESPSFPAEEAAFVAQFASQYGIPLRRVNTQELDVTEYADNPPTRCYFCKTEMYSTLKPLAEEAGFTVLADGTNYDDRGDFRPGMKAAGEWDIKHPLLDVKMTKDEIREASRQMDLPTWDKPEFACLASRFPYGEHIDEAKLNRVGAAESMMRKLGFRVFRVRSHGDLARVEVGSDELERAFEIRQQIVDGLKQLNYVYITLDMQGFRSGSMNETLRKTDT